CRPHSRHVDCSTRTHSRGIAARRPDRSQRTPRTPVVVAGERGAEPPRRTVASRCRGPPLLAPSSGSPPETPLMSEDTNPYPGCFMQSSTKCIKKLLHHEFIRILENESLDQWLRSRWAKPAPPFAAALTPRQSASSPPYPRPFSLTSSRRRR